CVPSKDAGNEAVLRKTERPRLRCSGMRGVARRCSGELAMNDNRLEPLMRLAWLTVALLVPVALLNYLDRQMLAAMKSSMMDDIPDIATKANWGIVLGSFKWV